MFEFTAQGKVKSEMVFLCSLYDCRGKSLGCEKLALVPICDNRGGGEGRQTDRGEASEKEGNSFSLPWGCRSAIRPTIVTESFIYLRIPSVQSVSNSP